MEISLEDKDGGEHERKQSSYMKRGKFVVEEEPVKKKSLAFGSAADTWRCLDERCNGNQNILHVAASNILKTDVKSMWLCLFYYVEITSSVFSRYFISIF